MKLIKNCVICGKKFESYESDNKVTCSKECSRIYHKNLMTGKKRDDSTKEKISQAAQKRGFTDNLKKGTPAAQASPKSGRFETNSSSKFYMLKDPNGNLHKAQNLRNYFRGRCHLFGMDENENSINKISHGFYQVKKNMKKGKGTITYKDWTIESYDDEKLYEKNKAEE